MIGLPTILALLPKVGPVVAALPEFRKLVQEIVATLGDKRDQAELIAAYELALDDATVAHDRLQALVAKHGG